MGTPKQAPAADHLGVFAPLARALAGLVAAEIAPTIAPTDPARWQTVASEAARRGYPDARPFLEACKRLGVTVVGEGKYRLVSPAEFDAAADRVAAKQRAQTATSDALEGAAASTMRRRTG